MQWIANGTVVHAGTLNGNPLSLAAARATIEVLAAGNGSIYPDLRARANRLRGGIGAALREAGVPVSISGDGPLFQVSFVDKPAENYRDTLRARTDWYADFSMGLLDKGVLTLPDGRWYISAAHTDEDIDRTLEAVRALCAHA
jgi:glutamate-1-semialdehyde 2,1-aminomutase